MGTLCVPEPLFRVFDSATGSIAADGEPLAPGCGEFRTQSFAFHRESPVQDEARRTEVLGTSVGA